MGVLDRFSRKLPDEVNIGGITISRDEFEANLRAKVYNDLFSAYLDLTLKKAGLEQGIGHISTGTLGGERPTKDTKGFVFIFLFRDFSRDNIVEATKKAGSLAKSDFESFGESTDTFNIFRIGIDKIAEAFDIPKKFVGVTKWRNVVSVTQSMERQ